MAYSAYFEVEPAARSGGICRGRVVLTDESAARRGVEPEEFGAGAACAPSSASAVETDNAAVAGGESGESDAVGAVAEAGAVVTAPAASEAIGGHARGDEGAEPADSSPRSWGNWSSRSALARFLAKSVCSR